MFGHDIIVIGTSAGGLKALGAILGALPSDIDATVFIVQHLAADKPSILPKILTDISSLLASHPSDEELIEKGRIYVAPPDYHLLVNKGSMRVVRGPQENRFRPAIDALFRSAARAYGSRVVGVVLTGYLDDGTVGLQAVKKCGGVAIVQDPDEAEYPSMAKSALQYVKVDYCLALAKISDLLVRLSKEPASTEAYPVTKEIEAESKIAEQQMNTQEFLKNVESIGTRTTYTCPECNGSIWQIGKTEPLMRFRCHIGHSYTANVFLAEQTQNLENSLWSAVRVMEEKVTFLRHLSEQMKNYNLATTATKYEDNAKNMDKEVTTIRELILHGFATKRSIDDAEEE